MFHLWAEGSRQWSMVELQCRLAEAVGAGIPEVASEAYSGEDVADFIRLGPTGILLQARRIPCGRHLPQLIHID